MDTKAAKTCSATASRKFRRSRGIRSPPYNDTTAAAPAVVVVVAAIVAAAAAAVVVHSAHGLLPDAIIFDLSAHYPLAHPSLLLLPRL
ncbi:hypothetical protein EVG20_g10582 [Dentipellis fragilis]|uniref:Uncharacterized protein n=1 Tax=Dentipellis fragilis TaxID=205917 RepID=A0A4Y9XRI2_9AGAM|nr:hypothetical protein EVG20_g10582 [Dentipellis fragilis]